MILLHHQESELSRNLLATMPAGTVVVDCSNGIPTYYAGPLPSAFPSVVVDVPAYSETVEDWDAEWEFKGMRTHTVAAHQEVLRMPANWDAVAQYNAYAEKRTAQSPAE